MSFRIRRLLTVSGLWRAEFECPRFLGGSDFRSITQVLTVDTTAPDATINGLGVTNDQTPEITGTTEEGATITAVIKDDAATVTVAQVGAGWSATPTELGEGDYTVIVTAADALGNSEHVRDVVQRGHHGTGNLDRFGRGRPDE